MDPTLALISVLGEVAMAVALLPKRTKALLARHWTVPNFGCTALPIARSRGKGPNLTRAPTLIMIWSFGTHRPFGLAGVRKLAPVCAQYSWVLVLAFKFPTVGRRRAHCTLTGPLLPASGWHGRGQARVSLAFSIAPSPV